MEECFGQFGWKEFYRNRRDILFEYDKLCELTSNRPVKVAHGIGVEAYLRKWLSEFLPKKYGITSGYIIPSLYDDSKELYHYDIIIYNQLESPILWTESNNDQSYQGNYRAIPAKYVIALFEVKSQLTLQTAKEALQKLDEIKDFSEQLCSNFSSGIIFIELKESNIHKYSILKELYKGQSIFGFTGGMILRYDGDISSTGLFIFGEHEDDIDFNIKSESKRPLVKKIDDLAITQTEDGSVHLGERGCGIKLVKTGVNNWSISKHYCISYLENRKSVELSWSKSNFTEFCKRLLASLDGIPYKSTIDSFGMVFDHIRVQKAKSQSADIIEGFPHISFEIFNESNEKGYIVETDASGNEILSYILKVTNSGSKDIVISNDTFTSSFYLPSKTIACTKATYGISDLKKFKRQIRNKKLIISDRYVYYPSDDKQDLYGIDLELQIDENCMQILMQQ